jgi:hypothetical protein
MTPNPPIVFTEESQLPVQVVVQMPTDTCAPVRRVYVLRRTRRGGLLLNRDDLAQSNAT